MSELAVVEKEEEQERENESLRLFFSSSLAHTRAVCKGCASSVNNT